MMLHSVVSGLALQWLQMSIKRMLGIYGLYVNIYHLGLVATKPTKLDSIYSAQLQRLARKLNFHS